MSQETYPAVAGSCGGLQEDRSTERGENNMRIQRNVRNHGATSRAKTGAFAILLVASICQPASALQWERVVGGPSPGVRITDERPLCWFSPSHRSVESPATITVSNIQYDSLNRVIEYDAEGTANGYPIETHVYDGSYNSLSQVTAFSEHRYYPSSGNAYDIQVSGVTYDASGHVEGFYFVMITPSGPPAPPPPPKPESATNPRPSDGATDQPINVALSWSDGGDPNNYATSYDVYFSTQRKLLAEYWLSDSEFKGNQIETTYDPGVLLYGTDYYWRIDAKNANGTTIGSVWRFTTAEAPFTNTIYVDDDALGANNGSSWADAHNYLQDALAHARFSEKPVRIRMAQGIYTPDSNSAAPLGTGDRQATFQLINGVSLEGGYAGLNEADPNRWDIVSCKTTLSGDLDGNDIDVNEPSELKEEPTRLENSFHVVESRDTDKRAVLNGFTVTAGYTYGGGGGMSNGGSPTITNCTFTGNYAGSGGGGMSNGGSPTITNCTFSANYGQNGGGISNASDSHPRLINCAFSRNVADFGGGMYNPHFSNPTMTDCTFSGNVAGGGGGIYNFGGDPNLADCTFSENSARQHGGGLYSSSGDPTVTNCTFRGNAAESGGGGINISWGDANLADCTFSGNSAKHGGGLLYDGGDITLANCTFSGNSARIYGGGMQSDGDATLNNCTFSGNYGNSGGGLHNDGDLTLTNCRFSGNYGHSGAGLCNEANMGDHVMTNCTFSGNYARSHGGGLYNGGGFSNTVVTNCTFSGNYARSHGGGLYNRAHFSNPIVTNCILWSDMPDEIYAEIIASGTPVVTHCDVEGIWSGKGNIDADPSFANPGHWVDVNDLNIVVEPSHPDAVWIEGDWHLKSKAGRWDPLSQTWVVDDVTSPCVDAGDPTSVFGLEPAPNGGRINMGAYGGTAEASKSP